jgi:hypothetical protein
LVITEPKKIEKLLHGLSNPRAMDYLTIAKKEEKDRSGQRSFICATIHWCLLHKLRPPKLINIAEGDAHIDFGSAHKSNMHEIKLKSMQWCIL